MGEYEPDDSRDVTLSDHQAPGEPPRTGPREAAARAQARQGSDAERAREHAPGEPPRDEEVAAKDAQDARREGGPARET
jgi:hypothetical protein